MTQTAYAVRRQAGGEWWSRYGGFGPFWSARIYQSGERALWAYKYHCRSPNAFPESVEVVEVLATTCSTYDRWPKAPK